LSISRKIFIEFYHYGVVVRDEIKKYSLGKRLKYLVLSLRVTLDQIPYWMRMYLPWILLYSKTSCTTPCEIEILAPKKIHTRSNPYLEAAVPMSDPEKIVCKRK
jgi:hypothetical protein